MRRVSTGRQIRYGRSGTRPVAAAVAMRAVAASSPGKTRNRAARISGRPGLNWAQYQSKAKIP